MIEAPSPPSPSPRRPLADPLTLLSRASRGNSDDHNVYCPTSSARKARRNSCSAPTPSSSRPIVYLSTSAVLKRVRRTNINRGADRHAKRFNRPYMRAHVRLYRYDALSREREKRRGREGPIRSELGYTRTILPARWFEKRKETLPASPTPSAEAPRSLFRVDSVVILPAINHTAATALTVCFVQTWTRKNALTNVCVCMCVVGAIKIWIYRICIVGRKLVKVIPLARELLQVWNRTIAGRGCRWRILSSNTIRFNKDESFCWFGIGQLLEKRQCVIDGGSFH